MKYNGVVIKLNELFLFLLDPKTLEIKDGINISEHEVYNKMKDDQLMVVDVIFKDGTEEIDDLDLDEFIYGDKYGKYDTFIYIQDIMLFLIKDEINGTLKELIDKGDLTDIATDCIEQSKNIKNNRDK